MKIKKAAQNYVLVTLLAIGGLVEAISGFVLWFALPHGGGRLAVLRTFWSLSRDAWVDMHDWAAVALMAVVIIHIAMHWKWVVHMTARYFRIPALNERKVARVKVQS